MFERFTDQARRAVVLAQEEARLLNHNFIGTEHVLLGLLREGEGLAAKILRESGADLEALRRAVSQMGSETRRGEFDPDEREMIEIPAEHFVRLVGEVARLRDLLRHHGIDPGEELPELGPDGEPR